MIFNTNNALSIEKKDVNFLEAGIHENATFVGIKKERSANGNLFIEFEFEKDGQKLTNTEWEPNRFPEESDKDLDTRANIQLSRILQIMQVWYDKSQLGFEASDYEGITNWIVTLMSTVDKTKKLRIKVVYGKTGYTSLPKSSTYTFIESMEVSADKSAIRQLKGDLFERPTTGDVETQTKSAESVFAPKAEPAATDMPF
jgi:hypothetical protein